MSLATLPHSFQANIPSLNDFAFADTKRKSFARIEALALFVLRPQNVLANDPLSVHDDGAPPDHNIRVPNPHGSVDKGGGIGS